MPTPKNIIVYSEGTGQLLIFYLTTRNIRMQTDLADQLLNSTEKRLARLLLTLANNDAGEGVMPIVPKINQETLAEAIGTSRTHVNFFMIRFRRLGLIDYNGEIKINGSYAGRLPARTALNVGHALCSPSFRLARPPG